MTDSQKITFKSVRGGASRKCVAALEATIKDDLKLMQDQIVSISIHDTKIRHGDLEAVVFYRTQSTVDNSEPLESLSNVFVERDEDAQWSEIQNQMLMNANNQGKKTIAIASTFRAVGEEKISVIYQIDGKQQTVYQEVFTSQESWEELTRKAENWLNTFIIPKEFAGLVFYEEEHPLKEREVMGQRIIVIYHTAGENPSPISEIAPEVIGPIYNFKTISRGDLSKAASWEPLYDEVIQAIENSGETEGFFVATAITSDDDLNGYQTAIVVKYDTQIA